MRVLVIKQRFRAPQDAGFAGGQHVLRCVARSLQLAGHDTHLLYCDGDRQAVFQTLLLLQGSLATVQHAPTAGVLSYLDPWGGFTVHVSCAQQQQQQQQQRQCSAGQPAVPDAGTAALLAHVLALLRCSTRAPPPPSAAAAAPPGGLLAGVVAVLPHPPSPEDDPVRHAGIILDADGCSEALWEGLLLAAPRRVFALVQNVHFLPFGPQGCGARRPDLQRRWGALAGVLCMSSYVADYVGRFGPPQPAGATRVAPPNTWAAFGAPPWTNWGPQHCRQVQEHQQQQQQQQQQHGQQQQHRHRQQHGQQRRLVVAMLKVTPEKGAALFAALARRLPRHDFLGVCGDAGLARALEALALPNLRLQWPVADVGALLRGVHVVVAPALWREAFGMVVVDAMLRGVPVLASDVGGLPEAALGAAALLPVQPMQLPPPPGHGGGGGDEWWVGTAPDWRARVLPGPSQQPLGAWAEALEALLGCPQRYAAASRAAHAAAVDWVQRGPGELQGLLEWMAAAAAAHAARPVRGEAASL